MMETERVRLRVVFENDEILSKSQRAEGLGRSWIVFNPSLQKTISHLSSYFLHIFRLHDACPHGLLLSMDGFVLPSFESSSLLKDNDIICVKKRSVVVSEVEKLGNGLDTVKFLANEEFNNETGGYESELEKCENEKPMDALVLDYTPEVDKVSKKKKTSSKKKLQGSKRKRSKLASAEESPVVIENDNDDDVEKSEGSGRISKKKRIKKDKSSKVLVEEKSGTQERLSEHKQNDTGDVDASMPLESDKLPSRSSRRKRAKRQWLREQNKFEKMQMQNIPNDSQQSRDRDDKKRGQQQPDQIPCDKDIESLSKDKQIDASIDAVDDVVPVVVRPGHIRFEVLGQEDDAVQTVQNNHTPVENFNWNGITSKKKGQKWGTNKASSSKWSNENFSQEYPAVQTFAGNSCKEVNFENFRPYTGLPKEGDVIAYKLIELTSSWTPEPSSFRVGKIAWYNSESNRVKLIPVEEFPLDLDKKANEDEAEAPSAISNYEIDGSLKIDFSLLIDVRIVRNGDLSNGTSVTPKSNVVSAERQDVPRTSRDSNINRNGVNPLVQENGKGDAWEEIDQVLSAKKAELLQVEETSKESSSGRWSYKALRSSALGPTIALLRSQNERSGP